MGEQVTQEMFNQVDNTDLNNNSQDKEEESEDEGQKFGDILSPGGQSFTFGSFEQSEIKKLWKVKISETKSTAINEYGSNFITSKFDSLAAIEAKTALLAQSKEGSQGTKCGPMVKENTETITSKEVLQSPSPPTGTQEGPEYEWSSQEMTTQNAPKEYLKGALSQKEASVVDWGSLMEEETKENEKTSRDASPDKRGEAEANIAQVVDKSKGNQHIATAEGEEEEQRVQPALKLSERIKKSGEW